MYWLLSDELRRAAIDLTDQEEAARERQTAAILAVRGIRKRIEAASERHNPARPELPPSGDDR